MTAYPIRGGFAVQTTSGSQAIASDGQAIKTSDRKRAILSYIEDNGQITTSEAIEQSGISSGRARQIFREIADGGLIEKVGNNRYAYYVAKNK
ncbi:MAG: winged helix-turn-helix domain-containing protein [Clostridiales Family XIII bacterium]|nr:winged helix-turn-helix domain-containing protein [Clostridiales Family XIII bacterium]